MTEHDEKIHLFGGVYVSLSLGDTEREFLEIVPETDSRTGGYRVRGLFHMTDEQMAQHLER